MSFVVDNSVALAWCFEDERRRLTAYDATYLEPAMRAGLRLATRGAELITAAKVVGVTLTAAG